MQKQEMEYLARVLANIVKAQGASREEAALVAGHMLMQLADVPDYVQKVKEEVAGVQEDLEKATKPIDKEPPKPGELVKHQVLERQGKVCSCVSCGQDIYKLAQDIVSYKDSNTGELQFKVGELIDAAQPIGKATGLSKHTSFRYVDDVLAVGCSLCGGEFSVGIVGQASTETTTGPQGVHESAGSFGADELGLG